MFSILIFTALATTISVLMSSVASILGKKTLMDREKTSPFECGFDPSKKSRMPFSLRFFLITMIFLIFDVEVALLLPLGILIFSPSPVILMLTSLFISIVLILGIVHEWNQGALKWIS